MHIFSSSCALCTGGVLLNLYISDIERIYLYIYMYILAEGRSSNIYTLLVSIYNVYIYIFICSVVWNYP